MFKKLFLIFICVALLVGCVPQEKSSEIKTCISLAPSITETICALNKADMLIGVDVNSNYPQSITSLPKVGDFNGPDVEKIVSLNPDVIFAGRTVQDDAIEKLRKLGYLVVEAEPETIDEIYETIALIGQTLGCEADAETLSNEIKQQVEDHWFKNALYSYLPTTYYAMSYGDLGNWTCGNGSFINELIGIAGGLPAVTLDTPWLELNLEQIVVINPDVILVADDVGSAQQLLAENGYSGTNAALKKQVFEIDADLISRPGPRIVEAIEALESIFSKCRP